MTKKNSFYFTSEIISQYAQVSRTDEKLIRDIYYFYVNRLKDSVKNNDHVAYNIMNLGTLYLTLTGANYELKKNSHSRFYSPTVETKLESKKRVIEDFIDKLKEKGIQRIPYFRKVFNPKGILNNE